MIKRLWNFFYRMYYTSSSDRYISYLRKKGIKIGSGSVVFVPKVVQIDITRPELLEIGNHVFIHKGNIILTHDWASWCFVEKYNEFIPAHNKVKIGNNVWFGENVTIMPGVTIGDNVIIGIGSIVTKSIPSNSVAVGIPAKVICTFEEYYKKRQEKYVHECFEFAKAIYDSGRAPKVDDFYDDYPLFVNGDNYTSYNYPYDRIFDTNQFQKWKKNHISKYSGFEEFLKAVRKEYGIP